MSKRLPRYLTTAVCLLAAAFAPGAFAAKPPQPASAVTCSGNATSLSFFHLPAESNIGILVNPDPIPAAGWSWPINLNNSNGAPNETLPFTHWPGPGTYLVRIQDNQHGKFENLGSCVVTIS